MDKFHFGDSIVIEGRVYYLQTQGALESRRIDSLLFDQGRVVERREWPLPPQGDAEALGAETERVHRERLQVLALIARIIPKVRAIGHAPSLFRLGRLLVSWRLCQTAKEVLGMVSVSSRWFVPARILLAEAEWLSGNTPGVIQPLREALHQNPHPDLWLAMAWYFDRQGEEGQAREALHKALTLAPESAQAHLFSAILALKASDSDSDGQAEAGRALERAVSFSGAYRRKEVAAAFRKLNQGETREALSLLEEVYERHRVVFFPEGDLFFLDFLYGEAAKDEERLHWHERRIREVLPAMPEPTMGRADWGAVHLVLGQRHLGYAQQAFMEIRRQAHETGGPPIRPEAIHQMQREMTEWIRRFFKQGG